MAQQENSLYGKYILLIIGGGIAAYKTPELVRRLIQAGANVRCILTNSGAQFVTPLTLAAISGDKVYESLFDLMDETEMGHIRLAREADLIIVAPATADFMAKMASGRAHDLAGATLLATDSPVLLAPAMNGQMWQDSATQKNLAALRARGAAIIGPNDGAMACGETGMGRMSEAEEIMHAAFAILIEAQIDSQTISLSGRKALVTAGPTHEPIDMVRYIANRSSGRQGYAIAAALAARGADTLLISGPCALTPPPHVAVQHVQTAEEMLAACTDALPCDIAVMAAAVGDWRVKKPANSKLKKQPDQAPPALELVENPDILAHLAAHKKRPRLLIGFAAETDNVLTNAEEKRKSKKCDWIIANNVSPASGVIGGAENTVHIINHMKAESWDTMAKEKVADRLAEEIADHMKEA